MKDLDSLKNLIKQHVSLGDLLRVEGKITGLVEEEQFSCTFHGRDQKKSARYYQETDTAYCWVCKEVWDLFSYTQKKEGISFGEVLRQYVREYKIDISVLPNTIEVNRQKFIQKRAPKVDNKAMALERLAQVLGMMKDDLPLDSYNRLVYGYIIMKYVIEEDKFDESYQGMKETLKTVISKLKEKSGAIDGR